MTTSGKSEPKEIALAIRLGVPHLERVAEGIRDYARRHTEWRFLLSPETHDLPPTSLKGWQGDGVIALCNTQEDLRVLKSLACPVVNISGFLKGAGFHRVRNDYPEIGRRAAEFLYKRGFRRFGFYGVEDVWYSELIEKGFRDALQQQAYPVEILRSSRSENQPVHWNAGLDELEQWLQSMQPPFAVMTSHDPRGAMVIRACERLQLKIPEQVAVLGVNDDSITCESCYPPLSSVDRNSQALGYRVAETLDLLIHGKNVPQDIVIPPGEIRDRESTQTLVIEHPALAKAVAYAKQHFSEPIGVAQMADAASRSRRWLETTFRKELHLSPAEFLEQLRVEAACEILLAENPPNLGTLAADCGFSGTRQLNAAFQRSTGKTVRAFMEHNSAQHI